MDSQQIIEPDKIEALAFDMDGTLWDAVDSYCSIWNNCFKAAGIDRRTSREQLISCMGLNLREILTRIVGDKPLPDADTFLKKVIAEESRLMPTLGGKPYPGVVEGLRALAPHYKLFLLSNCGADGLQNLMNWLDINDLICEAVCFGVTHRPKSENLKDIASRHRITRMAYVGDTQGDCDQTHLAGMPFIFVSYGFGSCRNADMTVNSFNDLVNRFLQF